MSNKFLQFIVFDIPYRNSKFKGCHFAANFFFIDFTFARWYLLTMHKTHYVLNSMQMANKSIRL